MTEIILEINGRRVSMDTFNDSVAMNYQANTLGEFKDRNSDYSQEIKLPRSPRNDRNLGVPSELDSNTTAPYRAYYPAEVLDDGIRVTPIGSVFYVTSLTKNQIKGQVVGPPVTLFEDLNAADCQTDKEDGFWVEWSLSNITPEEVTLPNGVRMRWMIATLVKNMTTPTNAGQPGGWSFINTPGRVYPHLSFKDVVIWTLNQQGWQVVVGDAVNTDQWLYIPCASPMGAGGDIDYGKLQYGTGLFSLTASLASLYTARELLITEITPAYPADSFYISYNDMMMEAAYSGDYTVSAYTMILGLFGGYVELTVVMDVTVIDSSGTAASRDSVELGVSSTSATTGADIDVEVLAGQLVKIEFYIRSADYRDASGTVTVSANADIKLKKLSEDSEWPAEPVPGATYDLYWSMGFSNRADLIKEYMQLFGLTIYVDAPKQTIYFYNLADVKAQIPDGYDWTTRYVESEDYEVEYRLNGYAQSNIVQFKEDEDNGIIQKTSFRINDSYLDIETVLWESKFYSIGIQPLFSTGGFYRPSTANYPLYEIDRDGEDDPRWSDIGSPLLVMASPEYDSVTLTQGEETRSMALMVAAQVDLESLFNDSYSALMSVLRNNCKTLECYFKFEPEDIENIDLRKPVWVGRWGRWFYLQKISNYQSDKLTKVNLIKLI